MHQAETVPLFSHDGSLTVPDCEAAPDGVFKNQGNPQPDAYEGNPPLRQGCQVLSQTASVRVFPKSRTAGIRDKSRRNRGLDGRGISGKIRITKGYSASPPMLSRISFKNMPFIRFSFSMAS